MNVAGRKFTFKALKNEPIKAIPAPNFDAIKDQKSFKYADLRFAYKNSTDEIRAIIDQFPIEGNHSNVIIDIKFHEVTASKFPCLPGWHTDCTLNPWHETRPEVHHIYVVGAGCRTRFLDEDFTLEYSSLVPAKIKSNMNKKEHKSWQVKEAHIYRYDRFGLHAPSLAERTEHRLLIRVTESDLIRPNAREYKKFFSAGYRRGQRIA